MKRVGIIGHFAMGEEQLSGQIVKTKIVTEELVDQLGEQEVVIIDTHGGIKTYISLPKKILKVMKRCENIVMFPAHNGIKIITPILMIENIFFQRKLHYVVIGGWLPGFLSHKKLLSSQLKNFDCIYVETKTMKVDLENQGFTNVIVMPNCKKLDILQEAEIKYYSDPPFKVCTFSRIMKEKGIEDAINAVKAVNEKYGKIIYQLDIYGQVDSKQTEWFEQIQADFPDYIKYGGLIPFDKSTEILKDYFALLFPTYYEGEGFAGTLIDAMAAGVPAIVSDWKYNSELVKEGKTGRLFKTHDVNELVEILENCYLKREVWNNMKTECVKVASKYLPGNVLKVLTEKLSGV